MDILLTDQQANAVSNRQNTDINRERHAPIVFLNHHLKIYSGILVHLVCKDRNKMILSILTIKERAFPKIPIGTRKRKYD